MEALLAFSITLFLAVLLSERADRSIISTAVLFLMAGFIFGGVFDLISIRPGKKAVSMFAELALFSVLFTDGMRVGFSDLSSAWRLPGRALILGMPLTLLGIALIAYLLMDLSWGESILIGAVLSPTDPVFAAALVGREEIPARLRNLLNVESGLNDGLALPVVVIMIGLADATKLNLTLLLGEVAMGIGVGIIVPLFALWIGRRRFFSISAMYEPFDAFAIGLIILALASLIHANVYLAAFAGGITIATVSPETRDQFSVFGERLTELLKLAALFVFGGLISPAFLHGISWSGYLFTALVLLVARFVALGIALFGSALSWRERIVAGWFGPKGFASVVYGLLILQSDLTNKDRLFSLVAIVVVCSIIIHSSTDVLFARWFRKEESEQLVEP